MLNKKIDISHILKTIYSEKPELFEKTVNKNVLENIDKIYHLIINYCAKGKRGPIKDIIFNVINSQNTMEKTNLEINIKKQIENKLKIINKQKDKNEIICLVKKMLKENKDKRLRTAFFTEQLSANKNNQFNNYDSTQTRNIVKQAVSEFRIELRNDNFTKGYVISKGAFKGKDDEVKNNIDGWEFTEKRSKIRNYILQEIKTYKKLTTAFENYLDKFDKFKKK